MRNTPAPRRVALLGGSFNPAHAGHRHISLEVLKLPEVDEVWWLVSPANPLKDARTLGDYRKRFDGAQKLADHPRIRVLDIEQRLGTRFTYDTVTRLQQLYPATQFIWLMGADNLASFHRWYRWREIAARIPILIVDRVPFAHHALRGKAAVALAQYRQAAIAGIEQGLSHPKWRYLFIRPHPASSTDIRKRHGKK